MRKIVTEKKKAFTLAEVLITLTIIGVVAAITVPTLTKKTGNQEYVTRLQKVYSVLSQATDEIIMEKGNPTLWHSNVITVYDAFKEYLRISKDCGSNSGCWEQQSANQHLKYLNGTPHNHNWNGTTTIRKLILADGTTLAFWFSSQDCSTDYKSTHGYKDVCSHIWVDINGVKGPNTYGRDIFTFAIKKDGLYPGGTDSDDIDTLCKSGTSGWGCAARVILEGEMNY